MTLVAEIGEQLQFIADILDWTCMRDNAMEAVKAFSYIRIWGVKWGKLLG